MVGEAMCRHPDCYARPGHLDLDGMCAQHSRRCVLDETRTCRRCGVHHPTVSAPVDGRRTDPPRCQLMGTARVPDDVIERWADVDPIDAQYVNAQVWPELVAVVRAAREVLDEAQQAIDLYAKRAGGELAVAKNPPMHPGVAHEIVRTLGKPMAALERRLREEMGE